MRWSGILLFFAVSASAQQSNIDFSRDIQPVFEARCLACHGAGQQMSGLRLDQRESALRVLSPGKSSTSRLIRLVSGSEKTVMPPVGDRLTAAEVGILRRWIDEGATYPTQAAGHWSFQKITRPAPAGTR